MNKVSNKHEGMEPDEQEDVWPPPPIEEEQSRWEQEEEEPELFLTKIAWLDALVGLVLGPTLLFILAIIVTIISAELSLPLRTPMEGIAPCLVAAGLCAAFFWRVNQRFRMIAASATLGAAFMLLYLISRDVNTPPPAAYPALSESALRRTPKVRSFR